VKYTKNHIGECGIVEVEVTLKKVILETNHDLTKEEQEERIKNLKYD
jgi:hypothetical protein